ncbi:TPR end-of-group domain-containing protein [Leptospira sanjuanensis]|uniref:TPR end-of-group domain-containing protein n=1 Tax=Leptospira sanjuanensis TaxID=2879643 RepID=UPI001EE8376A|nr:hypothetical protein [Leptospira sanjuanensis]MCG6168709.1 hypothetical protein [Leptospira sanjuanensis]
MNLKRIFLIFFAGTGIGFFVNCALLFPVETATERWRSSVQKLERSSGQERRLAEKEYVTHLESFQGDSIETKESLRNFILAETASRFNSQIAQKDWAAAAFIASIYAETIPFLGIGDITIKGTKSGNLYSAREYFVADLIAYTGESKDDRFLPLIQKMIPNPIGDARLAFNLACLHALNGNKQEMLQYMKIALFLGKETVDFENDSDFNAFRSDPDFIKMIWDGPALNPSLIPPASKPNLSSPKR